MTREEIIKIFEENHIAKGNATINATKLAEIFTKHETDLLKEFVEWYKGRLEHIQEHEKELLDDDVKHEYSYLVEYRKGTTDMLDRLLLHIDKHLEKFMEERK